jgi:2-hydroxy-3-keto-5-methylthiopentenyl-1-phosphate phosphatase
VTAALAAAPPAALVAGAIPLALLIDYDGTIARTDVSDAVMGAFVNADWESRAAEYDAGLRGSRELMEWEVALIRSDPAELRAVAAAQPHDPGFAPFVRTARAAGALVEVVSDGFGFFIQAALDRLGVGDVPIVTATTTFSGDGRAAIHFPNGHPSCFVCGTCKRNRVLAHQAAGRAVVFVGDGHSDRYAAGYSDVVFAKDALLELCRQNGWPYRPWSAFAEIDAWLVEQIVAWRGDPGAIVRPRPHRLYCGPEVWGEGRHAPPVAVAPTPLGEDDEGLVPG